MHRVISEYYDENNSLFMALPEVLDTVPPEVMSTNPAHGAVLKQVDRIVITLRDLHGAVNDAAVIESFHVTRDGRPVSGSVSELNDVFTFISGITPLEDGLYQVSLRATDVAGNALDYTFSFTVDGDAPATPVITGGLVLSGLMEARPFQNASTTRQVTLTGTRDDETSVVIRMSKGSWIGNVIHVGAGQTFSTIQAAVDVSEDGDTILIEPGTYNECVRITKWINLKGNTLDVVNDEVRINGTDEGNITFGITHDSPWGLPIYVEGLTLQTSGTPNPTSGARLAARIGESDVQTTGSGKIIWNRCRFLTTSAVKVPFSDHDGGTTLEFENCYFERGDAHFLPHEPALGAQEDPAQRCLRGRFEQL